MASITECCEKFISSLGENDKNIQDSNKKISDLQEQTRALKVRLREAKEKAIEQQRLSDSGQPYSATIIQDAKAVALEVAPQIVDSQRILNSEYEQKNFLLRNKEALNRLLEECKTKDYNGDACYDVDLAEKCCENIPPEIQQAIAEKRNAQITVPQTGTVDGFVETVADPKAEPASKSVPQTLLNQVAQFTAVPTSATAAASKQAADAQQSQAEAQAKTQAANGSGSTAYSPRSSTTWGLSGETPTSLAKKTRTPPKTGARLLGPASPPASKPTNVTKVSSTLVRGTGAG